MASKTKGQIGVTTENIFPVIKQFLYSDHEIFLRELVANAVDATEKLKALASSGEVKEELGEGSTATEEEKYREAALKLRAGKDIKEKLASILCVLHEQPGLRTTMLSNKTDIPVKSVERYVKRLKDAGLIKYSGSNKSGGYFLSDTILGE